MRTLFFGSELPLHFQTAGWTDHGAVRDSACEHCGCHHPFSYKTQLRLARLVFQFVLGRLTKLLRLSNATRYVKAPCQRACGGPTSGAVKKWAINKLQRSQLVTLKDKIKYEIVKSQRMCCGSLLSTVMSSATCECIDQQQRLTRRNLFTAVQTNSKSTVFVFKFEFYGRLCFLQINFLVWLFRIQNKAALQKI